MRNQIEWLKDIFDAILQIEKYAAKGERKYFQNELIQKWMVYHLQIIGEAANKTSEETKRRTAKIPWDQIVGLRNIIVHEYFGIDLEEIWNTIQFDIPKLKVEIDKIIQSLNNQ